MNVLTSLKLKSSTKENPKYLSNSIPISSLLDIVTEDDEEIKASTENFLPNLNKNKNKKLKPFEDKEK